MVGGDISGLLVKNPSFFLFKIAQSVLGILYLGFRRNRRTGLNWEIKGAVFHGRIR